MLKINKYVKNKLNKYFGKPNAPDFLIIGTQKGGTVSLKDFLLKDNRFFSPDYEMTFFSTLKFNNGYNWYQNRFKTIKNYRKYFDTSPNYIYYPTAAERIYTYKPEIKLIVLLRNPVDRAFSGWNHYRKHFFNIELKNKLINRIKKYNPVDGVEMIKFLNNKEYPAFKECILKEIEWIRADKNVTNPGFVRRGIYYEQLCRYFEYFNREQLLIIESNDLKNNKIHTLKKIYNFLETSFPEFEEDIYQNLHISDYKGVKMRDDERKILTEFFNPYNDKLFELLNFKYNW